MSYIYSLFQWHYYFIISVYKRFEFDAKALGKWESTSTHAHNLAYECMHFNWPIWWIEKKEKNWCWYKCCARLRANLLEEIPSDNRLIWYLPVQVVTAGYCCIVQTFSTFLICLWLMACWAQPFTGKLHPWRISKHRHLNLKGLLATLHINVHTFQHENFSPQLNNKPRGYPTYRNCSKMNSQRLLPAAG